MAQSFSIATAVDNSSFFGNLTADDGSLSRIRDAQVCVCTAFGNLAVPDGATIDGIEIYAEANSNTGPNEPDMFVYNGSSWSSALSNNSTWGKSTTTIDPAWGSNSNLWGLSWTSSTAEGIKIKMDSSSITSGRRIFFDWIRVRVTYTEAGYGHEVNNVAAASIAKVKGVATASIAKVNGVD